MPKLTPNRLAQLCQSEFLALQERLKNVEQGLQAVYGRTDAGFQVVLDALHVIERDIHGLLAGRPAKRRGGRRARPRK